MSEITKSRDLKSTMELDSPYRHQDDTSHDTLMGLQELDSHLSIFEGAALPGMQSSSLNPNAGSPSNDLLDISNDPLSDNPLQSLEYNGGNVTIDGPSRDSVLGPGRYGIATEKSKKPHSYNMTSIERIKDNDIAESMSSRSTFEFDMNSSHTSISSKGTSPVVFDSASDAKLLSPEVPVNVRARTKYDVVPKVSIPKDISHEEYARQCIAAAESSRLNPFSLHPEERDLLQRHISYSQVTTYLNIRNGILRLWVRNPLISVLRDEAIGCAKDVRWFDVANISYDWLVRRGYINYGCVENVTIKPHPRPSKRKRKTVVIIGAGMSGLGCARQLEGLFSQYDSRLRELGEERPRVIILEGRQRIGGRVFSHPLETVPLEKPTSKWNSRRTAEMGGMIITGFDRGNPMNIIVRQQLALPYYALRPTMSLYDVNGTEVNRLRDDSAERLYNDILARVSDYKFKLPEQQLVEGDKELIEMGRDVHSEGGRSIKESDEAKADNLLFLDTQVSNASASGGLSYTPSSFNRSTSRPQVELGAPAMYPAAVNARALGWMLKTGVTDNDDLDLSAAADTKDATLGSVMDEAISQLKSFIHLFPLDLRLFNWHIANLEYSNAINYSELSLGGWDVDAGNEWEGKHTMVIGGYQQVPRGLLRCPQPLDVRNKSAVKRISYSPAGDGSAATIECEDGFVLEADYVVSSIPLGVLKNRRVDFEPALPDWKVGAIERLGFGILNKVILVFEKPFWKQTRDIFGVLREPLFRASLHQKDYSRNRGRFFQWFDVTKTSGVPTLLALMAGDAAFQTELASDEDLIKEALQVLSSIFDLQQTPEPSEYIVTRWGQDRFACGSYSFTGPQFRPDDYAVMARPIGNLFFTGEHTCGTHPATVHGAYISGLRTASEVLEAIIGPIEVPEPLIIPKESLKRKSLTDLRVESKDPKQLRLEAYEIEIWSAIVKELGEYPLRPNKVSANPYLLFSKARFEEARKKCEEGRRPSKGKPVPNEVRNMCSKMWKQASVEERQPFLDRAAASKATYAITLARFKEQATKWDVDALLFRKTYEENHPSLPGPDEEMNEADTPIRRARRAKLIGGYAEETDSELELDL